MLWWLEGVCPSPGCPLSWGVGLSGPGALTHGLLQTLAGGRRQLHVTAAGVALIQHISLREAIKAGVLQSPGVFPHACPCQRGLEKFSDSLVFLGGRLPHNFKLAFHFSFLLQCLIQDILLVLKNPMEVPHLLLILSCLAGKVFLLLYQMVANVT